MVLKKGKRNVRCGSQIQSVLRFGSHAYYRTAYFVPTFYAAGNLSELGIKETFDPTREYSLNKRKRWLLPSMFRNRVLDDNFTRDASSNRTYILDERRMPSSFPLGRARTNNTDRVVYFGKEYKTAVELKSRGRMLDAYNVLKQLREGKCLSTKETEEKGVGEFQVEKDSKVAWDNCASLTVFDLDRDYVRKTLATYKTSSKVWEAMKRWQRLTHRKRGHPYSDLSKTGPMCCGEDEDMQDDEENFDQDTHKPTERQVTLGDLISLSQKPLKTAKKKSNNQRPTNENVSLVSKEKNVNDEKPTAQRAQQLSNGPFVVIMPAQHVEESVHFGKELRRVHVEGRKLFVFSPKQEPWCLYLDYATDDFICSAYVQVGKSMSNGARNYASLHEAYTSVDELIDDVKLITTGSDSQATAERFASPPRLTFPYCMDKFREKLAYKCHGHKSEQCLSALVAKQKDVAEPWEIVSDLVIDESDKCCVCSDPDLSKKSAEFKHDLPLCFVKLESCGHVLCCGCSKRSIMSGIADGHYKFLCPEPSCSAEIDSSVVAMLIGVDGCAQLLKNLPKLTCKCSCGALIEVEESFYFECAVPVTCSACNNAFCFRCGNEPHWPATCEEWEMFKDSPADVSFEKRKLLQGFTGEQVGCAVCMEHFRSRNSAVPDENDIFTRKTCWFCGGSELMTNQQDNKAKKGTVQVSAFERSFTSVKAEWAYQMGKKMLTKLQPDELISLAKMDEKSMSRNLTAKQFASTITGSFAEYNRISVLATLVQQQSGETDNKQIQDIYSMGKCLARCIADFSRVVLAPTPSGRSDDSKKFVNDLNALDKKCYDVTCSLARMTTSRLEKLK